MNAPSRFVCRGLLAAVVSFGVLSAQAEVYEIKVQNLTRGQHFTPLIFAVHAATVDMFEVGTAASAALEKMAEGGETTDLAMAVTGSGGMVANASGPLAPGSETTATITTPSGDSTLVHLSIAGMLLPTNDGFVGLDAARLPAAGESQTWLVNAYDAGSEGNSESVTDIPSPPFIVDVFAMGTGGSGLVATPDTTTEGAVHIHRGVIGDTNAAGGASDINATVHRWLNPVARVTVTTTANTN